MPVTEELKLVVSVPGAQQATNQLNKVKGSSKGAASGMMAMAKSMIGPASVAVAMGAIIKLSSQMVRAHGEQEEAEARLAAAIKATGKESSISADGIKALAGELQKVTTFGDEATIAAAGMLQQLADLNQKGLEQVIPGMQDFAAAMGVDLNTAASLIGKTLGSTTNALSRYGIEIDTTLPKEEKLVQLTSALEEKFGGTATEIANTSKGMKTSLKNAIGDLAEVGGKFISTFIDPLVVGLTRAVTLITEFLTKVSQLPSTKGVDIPKGSVVDINAWAGGIIPDALKGFLPGGAAPAAGGDDSKRANRILSLFGQTPEGQRLSNRSNLLADRAFTNTIQPQGPMAQSIHANISRGLHQNTNFSAVGLGGKTFAGPGSSKGHGVQFSGIGSAPESEEAQALALAAEARAAAEQRTANWLNQQDLAMGKLADVMGNSVLPAMETMGKVWAESGSAIKGVTAGIEQLAQAVIKALPEILLQLALVAPDPVSKGLLIAAALGTSLLGGAMGGSKSSVSGGGAAAGQTIIINNAGSLISQEDLVAQIEGVSRKAS